MRIFVAPDELQLGWIVVTGDEHHYLAHVRRAKFGDQIEVLDGKGRRAIAEVVTIGPTSTRLRSHTLETATEMPPRIRVLVPLIKGDRMDTCLEKLVEVGVDEIMIWPAAHAVVRLDADRLDGRLAKFSALLQSAARQCRRASIPTIASASSLTAAIAAAPAGARYVLDPTATAPLPAPTDASLPCTFASGPEGGLSPEELSALTAAGFAPISLGPRTLRAETAPVIAVALIRAATRS